MQTKKTKALPKFIYYRDDHIESIPCTTEVVDAFGATYTSINTWQELVKEIEADEDTIAFHSDSIDTSSRTIREYINAIQSIVKFMPGHKPLKILVVITPKTTQQEIDEYKKAGCLGIGLDLKYWTLEEAAKGAQSLINGIQYWPKQIISQLPSIKVKPLHIYFRETKDEDANVTPELIEEYNQHLPVHVMMCTNWPEFEQLIANTLPRQVVLHASRMSTQNATISEMIAMIQTRLKLYNLHNVPIAMVVERDTPLREVESWKRLGVFGLVPFIDDQDTHSETIRGVKALTNRIPHWPQHILDQLPDPPEPLLTIFFREDWREYAKSFDLKKFQELVEMNIANCSNWDELSDALARNPRQLIFHISMLKRLDVTIPEIMSMLETRMKLSGADIPVAVGIDPTTPAIVIKELRQAGVHGIIPAAGSWGVKETVTGIHALRDRVPYWPKHIIDQLPGQQPRRTSTKTTRIGLSPRQQQVFDLIKTRGLSNKAIARALAISENTVKMHVGGIMRAHGVKTRTQLAVLG